MAKPITARHYRFTDLGDLQRAINALTSRGFYTPHFSVDHERNLLTLKTNTNLEMATNVVLNNGGIFVNGFVRPINPYATPDDRQIAKERGVKVAQVRAERKAEDVPMKPSKAVKVAGNTYKVWIEIEELKADGDPTGNDVGALPDSIGNFADITEAMRQVARVVHAFGSDATIETSDSVKGQRPNSCKKCGSDLTKRGYCQDETCPYSDRLQHETYTEG